jgi:hypothetical protein
MISIPIIGAYSLTYDFLDILEECEGESGEGTVRWFSLTSILTLDYLTFERVP